MVPVVVLAVAPEDCLRPDIRGYHASSLHKGNQSEGWLLTSVTSVGRYQAVKIRINDWLLMVKIGKVLMMASEGCCN